MHRVQVNEEGSSRLIEPWIERLAKSGICDVAEVNLYTRHTANVI